jgi:hypothetical protein
VCALRLDTVLQTLQRSRGVLGRPTRTLSTRALAAVLEVAAIGLVQLLASRRHVANGSRGVLGRPSRTLSTRALAALLEVAAIGLVHPLASRRHVTNGTLHEGPRQARRRAAKGLSYGHWHAGDPLQALDDRDLAVRHGHATIRCGAMTERVGHSQMREHEQIVGTRRHDKSGGPVVPRPGLYGLIRGAECGSVLRCTHKECR